jgi:hypothetical protein
MSDCPYLGTYPYNPQIHPLKPFYPFTLTLYHLHTYRSLFHRLWTLQTYPSDSHSTQPKHFLQNHLT